MNPQQMQDSMRQQFLLAQRQRQANAQAQLAAQQNRAVNGTFILKLLNFSDHLSSFSTKEKPNDIEFWQQFVARFFGTEGRLLMDLPTSSRMKQFVVPNSTLARYWWTFFQ